MIVILLEKVPASLRGELTRWLLELKTGVFAGRVSAIVRDLLWQKCVEAIGPSSGGLLIFHADNEQGFEMRSAGNPSRQIVDFDGLLLIRVPHADPAKARKKMRLGRTDTTPRTQEMEFEGERVVSPLQSESIHSTRISHAPRSPCTHTTPQAAPPPMQDGLGSGIHELFDKLETWPLQGTESAITEDLEDGTSSDAPYWQAWESIAKPSQEPAKPSVRSTKSTGPKKHTLDAELLDAAQKHLPIILNAPNKNDDAAWEDMPHTAPWRNKSYSMLDEDFTSEESDSFDLPYQTARRNKSDQGSIQIDAET